MLRQRVNGYDIAYIKTGQGETLVCVHGSLGDFRVWSPVLGLLSRRHTVVALSLRHYFPEHWDGRGGDFTMAQHVDDTVGFIEALGGRVNLLGHSRGGHVAFRVAQRRPDLVRRMILAEPGGDLDASLAPDRDGTSRPLRSHVAAAAEKIARGDLDGGVESFVDAIDGAGAWRQWPAGMQQALRDNARTLLGQVNERREAFTRADAEAIDVPTLFIGGADTQGSLPLVLRALAAHVPGARTAIIPDSAHWMFDQDPKRFSQIVLDFLATTA